MSWFDFLDAIFGGSANNQGTSVQGEILVVDKGLPAFIGSAISYWAAQAGPFGQYIGMLAMVPGRGEPYGPWSSSGGGEVLDLTDIPYSSNTHGPPDGTDVYSFASRASNSRNLERLDRNGGFSTPPTNDARVPTVNIFGTPRVPQAPNRASSQIPSQHYERPSYSQYRGEIWIDLGPPSPPPLLKRRKAASKTPPMPPPAAADQFSALETSPLDLTESPSFKGPVQFFPLQEAKAPPRLIQGSASGGMSRPERQAPPRMERGAPRETATSLPAPARSTVSVDRTFWDRGGTGLTAGGLVAATGFIVLFAWNPIGWAAGATALAIAGGVAATSASAVELYASYSGATSAEQDAATNRTVSAVLGFSSPGGIVGGIGGMMYAEDAEVGFETGATAGSFAETGAGLIIGLPSAVRAAPGLWSAGVPWAKSLLLAPTWFFTAAGTGGGTSRSLTRVFTAQRRVRAGISRIEYLGTTPLLEQDAAWAVYQIGVTRSSRESVFRITYADGRQQVVLSDHALSQGRILLEAKYGDMGMMWIPERESHIIRQAQNYVDFTSFTGGQVRYLVSTELGAQRLAQRFNVEFPRQMASQQLIVDWAPWPRW